MCEICKFLREHSEILIPEILAVLYVIAGLFILYTDLDSGSKLVLLNPNNPVIAQIHGIIAAVAITIIFFGVGNIYTYYKDYENGKNLIKLQESLIRIEEKMKPLLPNSPDPSTTDEPAKIKGIDQIKLELEIDKVYLTAIGLAFTVESVFIGLYGKSLLSGIIDMQFIQILGISILFIAFMIYAWCDYRNKLNEVQAIFKK